MFMMKKLDNYEFIYPMWEDTNNQPGDAGLLKCHPLLTMYEINYFILLQKM